MAPRAAAASYAATFKSEVSRIARKEIRQAVSPLVKSSGARRHDVAALKREVESLKRQVAKLGKAVTASPLQKAVEKLEMKTGRSAPRFRKDGLISLRKRLGISANDLGKLIGVTGVSVYSWESGKTQPRPAQVAKLAAIRKIGKKEAAARLAD